jgi:hypothetical protein
LQPDWGENFFLSEGVLAEIILSVLGVADEKIIKDYALTSQYMPSMSLIRSLPNGEEYMKLPSYIWEAKPESMALFLSTVQQEYGSVKGYLETHNIDVSLFHRLKNTLLTYG